MTLRDIPVRKDIKLESVSYIEYGYLKGYVQGMLVDYRPDTKYKNYGYETLFRVHDPVNGDDMTLVSVDYGWRLGDDSIIADVEEKIKEEVMNIMT